MQEILFLVSLNLIIGFNIEIKNKHNNSLPTAPLHPPVH